MESFITWIFGRVVFLVSGVDSERAIFQQVDLRSFSVIFVFGSELGSSAKASQDFGDCFCRMCQHWFEWHSGLKRNVVGEVV